jgi:hypothetical protein
MQVGQDTLDKFNQFWLKYDPKGRGFISVLDFPDLITLIINEELECLNQIAEDLKNDEVTI